MYVPVEVLESAPITTPPSKVTAIIVVCGGRERLMKNGRKEGMWGQI